MHLIRTANCKQENIHVFYYGKMRSLVKYTLVCTLTRHSNFKPQPTIILFNEHYVIKIKGLTISRNLVCNIINSI